MSILLLYFCAYVHHEVLESHVLKIHFYALLHAFIFKLANERGNGAQNMWSSKPEGKRDFSHS